VLNQKIILKGELILNCNDNEKDLCFRKYPDEGYKTAVERPREYHFLSAKHGVNDEAIKEFNKIETELTTNVCNCGTEWTDRYSIHQKGCYPYQSKVCRECHVKQQAIEDQKESEYKRKRLSEKFENEIPPRYRGKLTSPINKKLLTANCAIIFGDFGTGKTWEAYTVAKEMFNNEDIKSFKMITEVGLLNELKADFDSMAWNINHYENLDLLIIDESGKNNDSQFNKAQLYEILNHRYDWERKTILICNATTKQELIDLFPTATLDRFRECVVEMNGKSKRYQ